MKEREEVERLVEGELLYDKMTRDQHGNPLVWKVIGPLQQARHNKDYFIRQVELVEDEEEKIEGEDAEAQRGYQVISPDNMDQFCKNQDIARLYFLLWDMEDGITGDQLILLRRIVDRLESKPTMAERLKGLGLDLNGFK